MAAMWLSSCQSRPQANSREIDQAIVRTSNSGQSEFAFDAVFRRCTPSRLVKVEGLSVNAQYRNAEVIAANPLANHFTNSMSFP